jgi:hypothetical protein
MERDVREQPKRTVRTEEAPHASCGGLTAGHELVGDDAEESKHDPYRDEGGES